MPTKFFKTETGGSSDAHSPTKLRKVYPVFYLALDCPLKEVDMTFEPRKTEVEFANWQEVVRFLEEAIFVFLKNNRLLVPTCMESREEEPVSSG